MSTLTHSELLLGSSDDSTVQLLSPEELAHVEGGYIPVPAIVWLAVATGGGAFFAGAVAGAAVYYYTHR
jgi:lactobin A/cerein 7B family class IIb bacteriocin